MKQLRPHVFDFDLDGLREFVTDWAMPAYRAAQVLDWVYQKGVADPEQMTNLTKRDRQMLTERLAFTAGRVVRQQTASDGVVKALIDWSQDDSDLDIQNTAAFQTECVMIPTPQRRTACISSQIGCPVGCRFCASGLGGLDGNLTAGQIVEQVWRLNAPHQRITNVVFMGMGEPLANFAQVVAAVGTLTADWGLNLSGRRITISTVGLPAQIRRLADMKLSVTLAISIHAPTDELRRELVPWARHVSLDQLVAAGKYYFAQTGREVTLEYLLLRHVNDRPEHAHKLAQLANNLRSNVNLIRYNEVKGLAYQRPAGTDVHQFQRILKAAGVNTHIRASRGRDIAAACGQLRHQSAVGKGV